MIQVRAIEREGGPNGNERAMFACNLKVEKALTPVGPHVVRTNVKMSMHFISSYSFSLLNNKKTNRKKVESFINHEVLDKKIYLP